MARINNARGEDRRRTFRDRVRDREKQRKTGGRSFNLPSGVGYYDKKNAKAVGDSKVSYLDIIPYTMSMEGMRHAGVGELWYECTFQSHYINRRSFVCPGTRARKCPVCDYVGELRKDRTPENEKIIGELYARNRQAFNVIDVDNPEAGIQILEDSYGNFGKQLNKELAESENEHPEYAGFAELKGGFTLKIRWDEEKQGGGKTYLKAGRIDFIPRKKDYPESILEKVVDLDKALIVPSFEEINAAFNGEDDEEESTPTKDARESEPEDSRPARNRRTNDEEEPEDRSFDEDRRARREDPRPPARRGRDDEEEEERPRGRRGDEEEPRPQENKCPVKGGEFGTDNETYSECRDCKIWDACTREFRNRRTGRR